MASVPEQQPSFCCLSVDLQCAAIWVPNGSRSRKYPVTPAIRSPNAELTVGCRTIQQVPAVGLDEKACAMQFVEPKKELPQ